MTSRRELCYAVIKKSGDMILQQIPEVFDDDFWCTGIDILKQTLVDTDNISKLVRKVILTSFTGFKRDRRTHSYRRNRQDRHDSPFRTHGCCVKSKQRKIFFTNFLKVCSDLTRRHTL